MAFGPIFAKLGKVHSQPYGLGSAGEVCQFFVKSGWCKWGDGCKFEHIPGPDTPTAPTIGGLEPSGEICQFFSKSGWCKYGDQCKHQHIGGTIEAVQKEPCNFFAKSGWCQYGASCKYAHISGPDTASTPGHSPSEPAEVCQFFAKSGWCKFGEQCRYKHISDTPAPVPERSGEVCQFFSKSGWCKYGDQCKHEHIGEATPNSTTGGEVREACQFFAKSGWCQYGNSCKYLHMPSPGAGVKGISKGKSGGPRPETYQFLAQNGWQAGAAGIFVHGSMPAAKSGIELSATQAESAAAALLETPGMKKAEAVGLDLGEDAVKALLTLPSTHASELLETVAAKHETLRDPSNYVVYTIAKGYVPRGFWRIWAQKMQAKRTSQQKRRYTCIHRRTYEGHF